MGGCRNPGTTNGKCQEFKSSYFQLQTGTNCLIFCSYVRSSSGTPYSFVDEVIMKLSDIPYSL